MINLLYEYYKALHAHIHRIQPKKKSDYRIVRGFSTDYVWESFSFAFPKKYSKMVIRTRLCWRKLHRLYDSSDSRPHGFCVCRLLLHLVLLGFCLSRRRGPAHDTTCHRVVYQYMTWHVMEWCMSPPPTHLGKLDLREARKLVPSAAAFDRAARFGKP